ncbi:MAG: endolytic transglycosylase MltG [Candidatus Pacebacteria bacterium]|nr:endolytic transglycosylase MltG [Candidatus Paceibacterota bacterium]
MRLSKHLSKTKIRIIIGVSILLGFSIFYVLPPTDFPSNKIIIIHSGDSLTQVTASLKKEGIVRSSFVLNNVMIFGNRERGAISGEYIFTKPVSVFTIAKRIGTGDFGFPLKRLTIPEGMTIAQIASSVSPSFFHFNKGEFLTLTSGQEGYLFPDTYFFPTNVTTENVIKTLSDNFDKKTSSLKADVLISGKTFKDTITMASILEEEALTAEDRKIVAGILWKRIKLGMRLQVDPPLSYVTGRNTYELTLKDLKLDSPYNTYIHTGLPPTPISNPGLESIDAAIHPVETKYFFYLSDKKGVMHYAATYAEHLKNKNLYLK